MKFKIPGLTNKQYRKKEREQKLYEDLQEEHKKLLGEYNIKFVYSNKVVITKMTATYGGIKNVFMFTGSGGMYVTTWDVLEKHQNDRFIDSSCVI